MSWIDPDAEERAELLSASTARMAAQDADDERAFSQHQQAAEDEGKARGYRNPHLGVDPSALLGFTGITGSHCMFLRGD